jgi:hypothetical protein
MDPMSQQELLSSLAEVLNHSGIEYMFTGSIVSSLQGEPRMSHDIDVLIEATIGIVPRLSETFPSPRYYSDPESIRDAIRTSGMFNLIDTETGNKIDFWMLTDSNFDLSRFARRNRVELFGKEIWVSSPEDTILAKLRWSKISGGSTKQLVDAFHVYELNIKSLDNNYLEQWILQLGLKDQWKQMLEFVEKK